MKAWLPGFTTCGGSSAALPASVRRGSWELASEEIDPGYYLMVYSRVPSSSRRRSLFGVVMLWAIDFLPLWKKVSGVQILLASRLLRGRRCIGPLNRSLSSFQLCRKKTSMVYSWHKETVKALQGLNSSDGSKNGFSKATTMQLAAARSNLPFLCLTQDQNW